MNKTEEKKIQLKLTYKSFDGTFNCRGDSLKELCFMALTEKNTEPITYKYKLDTPDIIENPSWYSVIPNDLINDYKVFMKQSINDITKYNKQNRLRRVCRILKIKLENSINSHVHKNMEMNHKSGWGSFITEEECMDKMLELVESSHAYSSPSTKYHLAHTLPNLIRQASEYNQLWVIRYLRDFIPFVNIKILTSNFIVRDNPRGTILLMNILSKSKRKLDVEECIKAVVNIDAIDDILTRDSSNSYKYVLWVTYPKLFKLDTSPFNIEEFKPPPFQAYTVIDLKDIAAEHIRNAAEYGSVDCINTITNSYPEIINIMSETERKKILSRIASYSESWSKPAILEFFNKFLPVDYKETSIIQRLFNISIDQSTLRPSMVIDVLLDFGASPTYKILRTLSRQVIYGDLIYKILKRMYHKLPPILPESKLKLFIHACRGSSLKFVKFLSQEFEIKKTSETHHSYIRGALSGILHHVKYFMSEPDIFKWLLENAPPSIFNQKTYHKLKAYFREYYGKRSAVQDICLLMSPYFKIFFDDFIQTVFLNGHDARYLAFKIIKKHGEKLRGFHPHASYWYDKHPDARQIFIDYLAVHNPETAQKLFDLSMKHCELNKARQLHEMGAKITSTNANFGIGILHIKLDEKQRSSFKYLQKHGATICNFVKRTRKRKRTQETSNHNNIEIERPKKKRKLI